MALGAKPDIWGCPDLGEGRRDGRFNEIPSSEFEFGDCPAYYRRTRTPEPGALGPRIRSSTAAHLIDGHTHPWTIIAPLAAEFRAGAVRSESLTPKVRDLLHLALAEQNDLEAYRLGEAERQAEENRKRSGGRGR